MTFTRAEPQEIVSSRTVISPVSQHAAFGASNGFSMTGAPSTVAWPLANVAIYIPFHVNTRVILYQVFWANGATVTNNYDVGVYDMAGNKLASTGSTAPGTVSDTVNTNWTDYTLEPGQFYMAMSCAGTSSNPIAWSPAAGLCQAMGICEQTSAFALPSTFTLTRTTRAYIPVFGFVCRSVSL